MSHSQHRWEKHGDDDVLAVDIQVKVNDQDDWVPLICDLTGWTTEQVEAFCRLTVEAYGKKEFPWEGEFGRHRVQFFINGAQQAVLWEGKVNKFTSQFKDAEMSFRIQGTVEDEDYAALFIGMERNLVYLNINPLQMPEAEPSPQQGMDLSGDEEGVTREPAETEEP
jgi:hypothetical protein